MRIEKSNLKRRITAWFVYGETADSKRLLANASEMCVVSVAGDPPKSVVAGCHAKGMEVLKLVVGKASDFDRQSQTRATVKRFMRECLENSYDGIDLDYEMLDPSVQNHYSRFLRELARALHGEGRRLSICVGYYAAMCKRPPARYFYDPEVVGETCDEIRVMCYDMHFAPASLDIGPTSTRPWARDALSFWLQRVPRAKIIMGLPAYSNDYDLTSNGKGRQIYGDLGDLLKTPDIRPVWLPYEEINCYRYTDKDGRPHLCFASDAQSTRVHLETARDFGITSICFWHYAAVTPSMWKAVREWAKAGR